jgi:hypothetical protein
MVEWPTRTYIWLQPTAHLDGWLASCSSLPLLQILLERTWEWITATYVELYLDE